TWWSSAASCRRPTSARSRGASCGRKRAASSEKRRPACRPPLGGEPLDRLRLRDAEALGVVDALDLQAREHVLLFHALGDHLQVDLAAQRLDRAQLSERQLALQDLAH